MATSKRTRSPSRSKTVSRTRATKAGKAFGKFVPDVAPGATPTWEVVFLDKPHSVYDTEAKARYAAWAMGGGVRGFVARPIQQESKHGMATGRAHTAAERAAFDRGYDAGNYANAYVSESLSKAWKVTTTKPDASVRAAMKASPKSFKHGFILGFFSSYEDSEVPVTYQDEFFDAVAAWGRPD